MRSLFEPMFLGSMQIKNRIVMAPMTRCRAPNHLPNSLMAKYYSLRADAGLIISEGTSPSANGLGYARIPGLYNAQHVNEWKLVTDAVHKNGGKFFVQLMHTGRVSHPLNMPKAGKILAPSAVANPGVMWTDEKEMQAYPVPTEMNENDIQNAIQEFAQSCKLAIEAGFDGVELHGANGYLIDQFLNAASNQRKDKWGGSVENRIRFAVEVATACAKAIGAGKLGIRISPYGVFNGMMPDAEMDALYEKLVLELNKIGLLYIHVVDHSAMGAPPVKASIKTKIRESFKGNYILSGGYNVEKANIDLVENKGDLVAFGRPFISNPDLVMKMKKAAPLIEADMNTFYTAGEKGYTDY